MRFFIRFPLDAKKDFLNGVVSYVQLIAVNNPVLPLDEIICRLEPVNIANIYIYMTGS